MLLRDLCGERVGLGYALWLFPLVLVVVLTGSMLFSGEDMGLALCLDWPSLMTYLIIASSANTCTQC